MTVWNPALWDDFGVVGIVVFIVVLFYVSLIKGWIVIGRHHNETVADKNETIARLSARSGKDAETINTLSKAVIETNATNDATTRILSAFREAVGDH